MHRTDKKNSQKNRVLFNPLGTTRHIVFFFIFQKLIRRELARFLYSKTLTLSNKLQIW